MSNENATLDIPYFFGGMHYNYNDVVIYDHKNKKVLTKKYNGEDVFWNTESSERAASFKEWFDANFRGARLTLLHTVSKQVSAADYPGWACWTRPGKYIPTNPMGKYTVCNFIVYDETTGGIRMLYPDSWLGTWYSDVPKNVSRYGAARITIGAERQAFRRSVQTGYRHMR